MEMPADQFELGLGGGETDPAPQAEPKPLASRAPIQAEPKEIAQRAPSEFFNEHLGLALTIARQFKTLRNAADHDDIDQAARLALHRASEAFRPDGGREFKPYAAQAVRNALNDNYRKTRQIGAREAFSLDAPAVVAGSGESGGEGDTWKDNWVDIDAEIASLAAAGHESSALLRKAIEALLPQQRAIVEAVLAGQTFSEIAEARGVSKQAANNMYLRAQVQIKNELLAMGVKGFEPQEMVLHETPRRYGGALLSAPVCDRSGGDVDYVAAEAVLPVAEPGTSLATPGSMTHTPVIKPVTPVPKGWWARLWAWLRGRR